MTATYAFIKRCRRCGEVVEVYGSALVKPVFWDASLGFSALSCWDCYDEALGLHDHYPEDRAQYERLMRARKRAEQSKRYRKHLERLYTFIACANRTGHAGFAVGRDLTARIASFL
jgi:hypothetical protein